MPRAFLPSFAPRTVKAAPQPAGRSSLVHPIIGPQRSLGTKELQLIEESVSSNMRRAGRSVSTFDYRKAVQQAYSRVVWAYRAVEYYAGFQAGLPIVGLEETAELPGRTLGPPSLAAKRLQLPVLAPLNGRANTIEASLIFRWRLSQQLLLSPYGVFVEITRDRGGEYLSMVLLPPGRTIPQPNADGTIAYYLVKSNRFGEPDQEIPEERVRWIKSPHPDSHMRSMTPLESAGMSIEVDYFARVYARSFMQNDGRPGGIVAIKGAFERGEGKRIMAEFDSPLDQAGRIVVINADDLNYTDTSKSPREVGYKDTREMARDEVLVAFHMYLSLIGDASARTFDNAAQEESNWATKPGVRHCDLIASAFKEDAGDGAKLAHDMTGVEAIQRPLRARKTELLADLAAGAISLDEYRQAIGHEAFNRPETRALWIKAGLTPIAKDDDDKALLAPPPAAPAAPAPDGGTDPAGDKFVIDGGDGGSGGGAGSPPPPRAVGGSGVGGPPPPRGVGGPPAPRGVAGPPAPRAITAGSKELKVLDAPAADDVTPPPADPPADQLAAELEAMLDRRSRVVVERLTSARTRRDTAYWTPAPVTPKPLDLEWVLQPEKWRKDAVTLAQQIVINEAIGAASNLVDEMDDASDGDDEKALEQPLSPYETNQPGDTKTRARKMAALAGAAAATAIVARVIDGHTDRLRNAIGTALAVPGATLDAAVDAIRALPGTAEESKARTSEMAGNVLGSVRGAARESAASTITRVAGKVIDKTWHDVGDDRVRETHKLANKQTVPVGSPFIVGGAQLQYPRDPDGPLDQIINCRCHATYSLRKRGSRAKR